VGKVDAEVVSAFVHHFVPLVVERRRQAVGDFGDGAGGFEGILTARIVLGDLLAFAVLGGLVERGLGNEQRAVVTVVVPVFFAEPVADIEAGPGERAGFFRDLRGLARPAFGPGAFDPFPEVVEAALVAARCPDEIRPALAHAAGGESLERFGRDAAEVQGQGFDFDDEFVQSALDGHRGAHEATRCTEGRKIGAGYSSPFQITKTAPAVISATDRLTRRGRLSGSLSLATMHSRPDTGQR